MDKDIKTSMENRYRLISALESKIEKRLSSLPSGRLKVEKRGDRVCCYKADIDSVYRFMGKDEAKLMEGIIQRNYLEKVLKASKEETRILKRAIEKYPQMVAEEVYDSLPAGRKMFVNPIIASDEQFVRRWQEKPYERKPLRDGTPVYETIKGDRVRSKSEQIIADRLFTRGIPYKYECPLIVDDDVIYPDFTILRVSDRKEVYLEHCGMTDKIDYADDMVWRMNKYALAGILQGDRLFLLFESSNVPLDARVVDKMIENVFK